MNNFIEKQIKELAAAAIGLKNSAIWLKSGEAR
jgi:hypothetical protein